MCKVGFFEFIKVTPEAKLRDFQFRCLHGILNVKYILKKKQLIDHDLCSFCFSEKETIQHLFIECTRSKIFWENFRRFWKNISGNIINLLPKHIILGKSDEGTLLNYLLILGKWHLYLSSQRQLQPNWEVFIALCNVKHEIEHIIAKKNNTLIKYTEKWDLFQSVITHPD